MSNLFALPIPPTHPSRSVDIKRGHKRKRRVHSGVAEQDDDFGDPHQHKSTNEEYTAVVSPDERRQRRAAGSSLEAPIPPFPFPHKDVASQEKHSSGTRAHSPDRQSLRLQHIANMTAILHRSMRAKDWSRARRALGLLLRTEINGQPIDLRNGEYWGLGAEILFRHQPENGKQWSRRGFEDAKDYYEKLIVRFPYHRSSSDSINAVDFYLALFSLWIYVAQAERASSRSTDDWLDHNAVGRELEEARLILARLDRCMGTAPYADNEDFRRLRSDIILWHDNLLSEHRGNSPTSTAVDSPSADLSIVAERLSL
jgi:hypothetical protein